MYLKDFTIKFLFKITTIFTIYMVLPNQEREAAKIHGCFVYSCTYPKHVQALSLGGEKVQGTQRSFAGKIGAKYGRSKKEFWDQRKGNDHVVHIF